MQRRNRFAPTRSWPQLPHTHKVPFIASQSHFTRKNTRFRAQTISQNKAHATLTQPLQCVLQLHAAIPLLPALHPPFHPVHITSHLHSSYTLSSSALSPSALHMPQHPSSTLSSSALHIAPAARATAPFIVLQRTSHTTLHSICP